MMTTGLLPTYRRTAADFEDAFGVPAHAVLRSMDEARDDLVEHAPGRAVALPEVGCERQHVVVHIADPFGSREVVPAVCTVRIATAVPPTRRGVHMSRIGNVLAELAQRAYPDPSAFVSACAEAVDRKQYGGPTTVGVEARIPYIEALPAEGGAAPKASLEHLHLIAARTTGERSRLDVGLRVTHIVACPCVQQTRRHARSARAGPRPDDNEPGFTHSQRCETAVTVCGAREWLPVTAALAALDRVLFRAINTLPRGRELLLVYRAHRSPQFVEDAVREAVWAMYGALDPAAHFTHLEASSRSLESIHEFDLSARAMLTREEARRLGDGSGKPRQWC